MRVLITGADGFIGKNLQSFLANYPNVDIDKFTLDNTDGELDIKIQQADAVVHLAGINRPQTIEEFYNGNTDLTKKIVDLLCEHKKNIPLIFSSSIQAALDNDYGKSKKMAEDYILEKYPNGIIYRLHNVFGKGCKPKYNSVVATFCNNIAHNEPIEISDPEHVVELIYIDDICKTFCKVLLGEATANDKYNSIKPVKKIKLGKLAETIKGFRDNLDSLSVPRTSDAFIKKLFSTYISYNDINKLISYQKMNRDERGVFSELIHMPDSGQCSFSTSKPGVVRGNHYHHTKIEKFTVVKGKALIKLRKIDDKKIIEIPVSGDKLQTITIPVGYTHNIENVGKDEMVLFIWCNEIFDKNNPDTYYMEV